MDPSDETREENEPSGDRCALIRDMDDKQPSTSSALVPYRGHAVSELSWEADSAWSLRMLQLMIEGARLKMLMAWCSTLGGAHSSLGEHSLSHAEVAGVISGQQLCLAVGLRDPLLATRCKLYLAYSLLQQGKLKQAAQIISEPLMAAYNATHPLLVYCLLHMGGQYKYITKDAVVLDDKLVTMCLAAWERLNQLRRLRKVKRKSQKRTLQAEQTQ